MAAPPSLAVPVSILDTDLYKFTMQQAILIKYPHVHAVYRFTNRNSSTMKFSRVCFERMRGGIARFSLIALTPTERAFLEERCPYLTKEYLDYLEEYRFKPEQVTLEFVPAPDFKRPVPSKVRGDPTSDDDEDFAVSSNGGEDAQGTSEEEEYGDILISASGPWLETILWEVPLMALLSEVYFGTVDVDWEADWQGQEEQAYRKCHTLLASHCSFSEFGTRRRRSFKAQEVVVKGLVRASEDFKKEQEDPKKEGQKKARLTGTSNVHLARLYNLEPIGTIAHEWFMAVASLTGYSNANSRALEVWEEVYPAGSVPLIALTDTFTSGAFFQDFSTDQGRVLRWTGLRQDSGSPFEFAKRFKEFYESMGIDPAEKLLVFSDALSVEKAVGLQKECEALGLKKVSYGIGTNLTNDFKSKSTAEKSKPLNIVIKLREVDGKPCVKLSDDLRKTTGNKATVDHVIDLYQISTKPESGS